MPINTPYPAILLNGAPIIPAIATKADDWNVQDFITLYGQVVAVAWNDYAAYLLAYAGVLTVSALPVAGALGLLGNTLRRALDALNYFLTNYQIATAANNTTNWSFWLRYVMMFTDVFVSVAFAVATAGVGLLYTARLDALWDYYFAQAAAWNQAPQAFKGFEVFALGVFIGGVIYFSQMLLQDFSGYATILFPNAATVAFVGLIMAELEIDLW